MHITQGGGEHTFQVEISTTNAKAYYSAMIKMNELASEESQDAWYENTELTDSQIADFEAKGISLLNTEMEDGGFVTTKIYHTFNTALSIDEIAILNKALADGKVEGFTATEKGYSFTYLGESNEKDYADWYDNIDNILKSTTNEWTNNYTSESNRIKTWMHTSDGRKKNPITKHDEWRNRSRTYNEGNRDIQKRFEKGEGYGNNRRNDTGNNVKQGNKQGRSRKNPQQSLLEEENHSAETQQFFTDVQEGKHRPKSPLKFTRPIKCQASPTSGTRFSAGLTPQ